MCRLIPPGIAISLILLCGCQNPDSGRTYFPSSPPIVDYLPKSAEEQKADRIRVDVPEGLPVIAGWSEEDRPIRYQVRGRGPRVILVMAVIHGDEPAGKRLVERLARHLDENPQMLEGRAVVLCPVMNPDGLARGVRWNARGVDLNRNYGTANFRPSRRNGREPLSERESRVVANLVTCLKPERVLSIHQPLACIDFDGPGRELAQAMGRHTHLPLKTIGARPGSLGSYVGLTLGIPIITLELPETATDRPTGDLWWHYGRVLLRFVRWPDSIEP